MDKSGSKYENSSKPLQNRHKMTFKLKYVKNTNELLMKEVYISVTNCSTWTTVFKIY